MVNQNGWRLLIYNRKVRMSIRFTIISSDLVEALKKPLFILYTSHKAVLKMNRIQELRVSRGWSQKKLGKMLNCTDVTVSRYELGQRDIDSETICKLCDIFGCTSDYLLCRASFPSPELTPEEETLLLSWRAADAHARAIVELALEPYKKDVSVSAPTA